MQLAASRRASLLEAGQVLEHGERLLKAARGAEAGTEGQLRLGFVGSSVHELLPSLIATSRQRYPRVALALAEGTSLWILDRLCEGWLDVGIVSTPVEVPPSLGFRSLRLDRFVAALPAAHPLDQGEVPVRHAAGERRLHQGQRRSGRRYPLARCGASRAGAAA